MRHLYFVEIGIVKILSINTAYWSSDLLILLQGTLFISVQKKNWIYRNAKGLLTERGGAIQPASLQEFAKF